MKLLILAEIGARVREKFPEVSETERIIHGSIHFFIRILKGHGGAFKYKKEKKI